jgi:fatty-acyl-CoA synthase
MNLYQLLLRCASRDPKRRALSFQGNVWSFLRMVDWADAAAQQLRGYGVRHGDRVAYWNSNDPSFFAVALACAKLGAVFVPLNFRLAPGEVTSILDEIGISGLVATRSRLDSLEAGERTVDKWWTLRLDQLATAPLRDDAVRDGAVRDGAVRDGAVRDGAVRDGAVRDDPQRRFEPPGHGAPPAAALILFTSGTTGRPRGIELSHSNLWHSAINVELSGDFLRDDVLLLMAPLSAVATWPWTMATWMKGGEVALMGAVDAEEFFRTVPERRVSSMAPVVALLSAVVAHPDFESADLSSLRWIVSGGAPLADDLRRRFTRRGINIYLSYGMTETTGMAVLLPHTFTESKGAAAGLPLLLTELRLVDEKGVDVAAGDAGEILLRGPNITEAIWIGGARTMAGDAKGWLHTGDVGRRDEDGVLSIVDRLKDMIKSGGENVYSAEVERILGTHDAVAEVAVVGAPDPRWGETVVAFVVLNEGQSLSLEDAREHVGRYLASYKRPTRLVVVDEFAKSSSGKIQKARLRAQVSEGMTWSVEPLDQPGSPGSRT